MKKLLILIFALVSFSASATHYHEQILDVAPIYAVSNCHYERDYSYLNHQDRGRSGNVLGNTIIGSAIGYALGGKKHRTLGTIIGGFAGDTLLGGNSQSKRHSRNRHEGSGWVKYCEPSHRITGYRTKYLFQGQVYYRTSRLAPR